MVLMWCLKCGFYVVRPMWVYIHIYIYTYICIYIYIYIDLASTMWFMSVTNGRGEEHFIPLRLKCFIHSWILFFFPRLYCFLHHSVCLHVAPTLCLLCRLCLPSHTQRRKSLLVYAAVCLHACNVTYMISTLWFVSTLWTLSTFTHAKETLLTRLYDSVSACLQRGSYMTSTQCGSYMISILCFVSTMCTLSTFTPAQEGVTRTLFV